MNSATALYSGFFILGVLLLGIFAAAEVQSENYANIRQAIAVRDEMHTVFSAMQDVETGQRGYLLTGDKTYLEPYDNAIPLIDSELKVLARALEGSPGEQKMFATFRDLVAQKLAVTDASIERREAGQTGEALALVMEGSGKVIMDQIRTAMVALLLSQDASMTTGFRWAERSAQWLRGGAMGAVVVIAGLAFVSFTRIRRQFGLVTAGRDDLVDAHRKLVIEGEQQEKLATQLRQSQKMEALGQLTGGLAHDFNNMLAVIVSSVSIIKRRMARGETDIARYLDSAMDGAERAATLTGRLLAFSRQQPLSPELIDPNKMVAGMSELLHRTLGETARVETVLAAGLWRTHVDASQLENAILNLALNARDAMPGGGNLTIETSNAHLNDEYSYVHKDVPPGQYVLIAVTDTGVGMAPNLIEKAFDPFFTTKPTGKGTGLGLSQVYGFVKQSGGHVSVYSEPGHGTTFKLYLPRSHLDESRATVPAPAAAIPPGHASEIILVVEDDRRVRQLSVDALRELGYTVVHADDGETALRQLEATPRVDLLFTDIVMPGINGRELATIATRRHPEMRVLYTSGYVPNAVVHNATLGPFEDLISKPFTIDQLARKVRQVFNRPVMDMVAQASPRAAPMPAPAPVV
jgi:signal transduction histidine kinase/ActR/RegA family two-component response regulator